MTSERLQVTATKPRYDFVDNMRAIGIVLVVVGHAPGFGGTAQEIIYGFHMPLFFFISGFLFKSEKLALGVTGYVGSLWRSLLVPYFFFAVLSLVYWWAAHGIASRSAAGATRAWYEPMLPIIIGYGHVANIGLWFFTCLAVTSLGYFLLRRYGSSRVTLSVAALSVVSFLLLYRESWPRMPWGADIAVVALFYYALGNFWSEHGTRWSGAGGKVRKIVIAVTAFAVSISLTALNGWVSLLELDFGEMPLLSIPTALAGIVGVMFASAIWRANAVTRWLSTNTIVIFPSHALMFSVFTGIGVMAFGLPHDFKDSSTVYGITYVALALALGYPAAVVLRSWFPWVFGRRPRAGTTDDRVAA